MEKIIYVNMLKLGKSIEERCSLYDGFKDGTNEWYVMKGNGKGVGIWRVWEEVEQLNHPDMALVESACVAIGPRIYAISGLNAYSLEPCLRDGEGSNKIRCIDTLNPQHGWNTCFTLPFSRGKGGIHALVDERWLYLFSATPSPYANMNKNLPWCYVVDFDESKDIGGQRGREITPPGSSSRCPLFCACLCPGTLVCYMGEEHKMYQLDCERNTWTSYDITFPFPLSDFSLCCPVYHDGILYLYDSVNFLLYYYDLFKREQLCVVHLPLPFFLFGKKYYVELVVLSRDRFCIISIFRGDSIRERLVGYIRFSVSHDLPKPTVEVEEQEEFIVGGFKVLNVVAVASPDATNMSPQPCAGSSLQSPDLTCLTSVHQFDGKNYLQWSLSFLLFIRRQGKEDYINGRLKHPPTPPFAKYATWRDENKLVMAWLLNSMTPDIRIYYRIYSTAREIWVAACKLYSSIVSRLISRKLHELNQGTMTVTVYYNTLTQLWQLGDLYESHVWTALANAPIYKEKVEMDRIYKFLFGLNPEYKEVRSKILRSNLLPSIREVFSTMKQEERCGYGAINKEEHSPNLDELILELLNDHEKHLE